MEDTTTQTRGTFFLTENRKYIFRKFSDPWYIVTLTDVVIMRGYACAVNDREVSLERFATLLLKETVRQAIRDAMPQLSRVEDVSSRSPLPQIPQATARVVSVEETARTLGLNRPRFEHGS